MFIQNNKIYKSFNDNKIYRHCFKNREFLYSNEAFDQKMDRIFEDINNVLIIDLEEYKGRSYDLFDGHYNDEANKFFMKKLSDYINNFENWSFMI